MKKAYYLFNPGRLSRKDNTLKFEPEADETIPKTKPRYLPIEGVSAFYVFGSLDANSSLFNFLGRNQVPVHFFDYYQHYTGSFSPKEYLLAGQMLIAQADAYRNGKKRLEIAQALVDAAHANMLRTLGYYHNRGKDLKASIDQINGLRTTLPHARSIDELMGLEGNARQAYYEAFGKITDAFPGREDSSALLAMN